MAVELNDFVKWLWTVPLGVVAGSYDIRLRSKVSKETCKAVQDGFTKEIEGVKKHVDTKFEAMEKYNDVKFDAVIKEIQKVTNG